MKKLVLFIKKTYVFALFVILEVIALNQYANSTTFTKAKMITTANFLAGGIYRQFSVMNDYFGLRRENTALMNEIATLNNRLQIYRDHQPELNIDSLGLEGNVGAYVYTSASVISNTLTRPENFFTLDKGSRNGVEPNMAVVTPDGTMVGYILDCSDKFSVGMSLLNTDFRTSGTIKGKEHLGSIRWDGRNHNYATLSEVQKYGEIMAGDTVVTADYSSRFPAGVMIGTVESFELKQSAYYDVKIKLATRFSALKKVLLIRYSDVVERRMLEEGVAGADL